MALASFVFFAGSLIQRIKHGTGKALGITNDTDFAKLKTVNQHLAQNLAGHSTVSRNI